MGKINVFVKLFQELLLGFVGNSEVFQTHEATKKGCIKVYATCQHLAYRMVSWFILDGRWLKADTG